MNALRLVVKRVLAFLSLCTVLYATLYSADAALKAPDFEVHSKTLGSVLQVSAAAPAGHHFNTDAPMAVIAEGKTIKPKSSSPQRVVFEVPSRGTGALRIALYLCDDAKTFCEKHEVEYTAAKQTSTQISSEGIGAPAALAHVEKAAVNEHGFIVNDPDAALEKAKREHKPVMIDFFGIWCPPCNQLDEKVFSSRSFLHSAGRFVTLKLDADSPVSWKLKSKFRVGGYPTVVFTSSEGDEISRIVGFRPQAEFLELMNDAWKNRESALTQLEAKAGAGDRDSADRAGIIYFERGDHAMSAKFLAGSVKNREYWHLAEVEALQDQGASNEKQIARINQAIAEFPSTPHSVEWYGKLADISSEKKDEASRKAALQHAVDLSNKLAIELAKNPARLKGYDATPADLLEAEADYREQLVGSGNAQTRSDWLAAAEAYRKQGLGDNERANNLEYAYCLGKGGDYAKAREVYERLERAYPSEFTFYFNHGRMEKGANELKKAHELFGKALEHAYGDNRLRVALSAAQTADQLGQRAEAKKIADQALQDVKLPDDAKLRTHRYADQLKKFRQSIN